MDFHIDQSRSVLLACSHKFELTTGYLLPHCKDTVYLNYVSPQAQCQNVCYLLSEQEGKTDDIQELQNKIMEVLRQEPYMGEKIPVR